MFKSSISSNVILYAVLIAIFIMWGQFIYWFRLFETTTLYIRLIRQTVNDILAFGFIFLLILLSGANLVYLLNMNRQ